MTEVTRWAMMILVVSLSRVRNASRILASVAVSTAEVESSRISTRGFFKMARAMQRRCFCPPETFTPPWPRSVSKPSGIRERNSSAQAARQASHSSSSVAFSSPQRRFSRMVPEKRVFFCSTMLTLPRRWSMVYSRTLRPPTFTVPSPASYSRGIRDTRLVLPLPVPPRIPTVAPEGMWRSISRRIHSGLRGSYRKETPSKSTDPFSTSASSRASASVMAGSSASTSATRLPQAMERVIIINIMETIISEIMIWEM